MMLMKHFIPYILTLGALAMPCAADAAVTLSDGKAPQLCVDGKPMLILGGELGNSSASSPQDIRAIFPKLKRMNLNTVLTPVYWDLTEPQEGKFDFTLVDVAIEEARRNDLKLVFLWFGAWKNSMSCYAPAWFKAATKRFPRAVTAEGKPLEIASAFSPDVLQADNRAFGQLIRHINEVDTDHTVLMIQVENEIGMLENARDHSSLARQEYAKGVPAELTAFLKKNRNSLDPTLAQRWKDHGSKMSGTWTEVFGDDVYTDEYFMAWNYAKYVEHLAKTARKLTTRPLYVNAAMNSRGRKPGEYPSAGPLAHLKDIWHAAAPTIDFLSPDLYDKGFTDWVAKYALPDNVLFIPEIRRGAGNAAQALYVLGEHDAIGLSPFSIENGSDSPSDPNVRGYAMIAEAAPLILRHQGRGTMRGMYFDNDSTSRTYTDGDLRITASHYFTLPWDSRATDGSVWPETGAVLIKTAPDEYILAGSGVVLKFEHQSESEAARKLGEDGFLDSGSDRTPDSKWRGKQRVGLAEVAEVTVSPDGRTFTPVRYFNGDETHQGRHVRIGVDDFRILRVKLYRY